MTQTYETLKISKTLRVDGLYDYNAEANDKVNEADPTSSLTMGQDIKDVNSIENKVSFSKAGYVDNKWLVSENGQIFKVSSVLAKEGGVLKSYKTGFASSEFRVDPEEIGLVFQNKPEVKDAAGTTVVKAANPEFEGFISGVYDSYDTNWSNLFGNNDSVFVKAENRNTPIDAAALRAALNEANPSLLKVLKLIFKESVITENKKLIEETDLYLRYLNKGITLAETGDAKYALDAGLLEDLKGYTTPLDPWYKGLKEEAANTSVSDADLIKSVIDQLSGVNATNADASNNVIAVLAVGEAPVIATAAPVGTSNEPDWTKAQDVVDHFNTLLSVIREKEGIDETGAPYNLKNKEDGKATAIGNFTFINTGSGPQLVTTDRALSKDQADMTAEDWAKIDWHPVKIDFIGFDDDAIGLFKKKRVDFGKKDATDEKSSIRLLDRYLHKLAGIEYGAAIDGEEIDEEAVADVDEPDAVEAPQAVIITPIRPFNGFEVANEALTNLTTKPTNQMDGVNREIIKVKPISNDVDEYGVVDQNGTAIMINGKSYPDITSLLIVLGELGLAEKEAAVGKVAEGLVLAIGVTGQKQKFEDQVIKVDYGVTTLGANEDAKIKAVAKFVSEHPEIIGVEIWGNADGGDPTGKYAKFRRDKGIERFGFHMAAISDNHGVILNKNEGPNSRLFLNSNSSEARRGVTFSFTVSDDSTGPDIKTVDYFLIPFLEDYVTDKNAARAAEVMKAVRDLTDLNELKVATKLRDNLKKAYGAEDLLVKALDAHIANLRTVASVTSPSRLGDDTFTITSDGETRFNVGTRKVTFPFTGDASGITVVDDWGQGKARKFSSANGVLTIDLGFNAPKAGDYALIITTSRGTKINVVAVAEAGGQANSGGGGSGSGGGGASSGGGGSSGGGSVTVVGGEDTSGR